MRYKNKKKNLTTNIYKFLFVFIIILCLIFQVPSFISALNRAKVSKLKENMHTLQKLIDLYAEKNKEYPDTIEKLNTIENSEIINNWMNCENPFKSIFPFISKKGIGVEGAFIDFAKYKNGDTQDKGLAIYKFIHQGKSPNYMIYGSIQDGRLLKDWRQDKLFILSN